MIKLNGDLFKEKEAERKAKAGKNLGKASDANKKQGNAEAMLLKDALDKANARHLHAHLTAFAARSLRLPLGLLLLEQITVQLDQ